MMSAGKSKLSILVCVLIGLFVLTGSSYAADGGPGYHQKNPGSSPADAGEASAPLAIYLAVGTFDPLRQTPDLPEALTMSSEQAASDGTPGILQLLYSQLNR